MRPILYFPVKPTPLQMEAGFSPLGRDLGGGELDQRCFLRDREHERYSNNKARVEPTRHWVTWSLGGVELDDLHHSALSTLVTHLEASEMPLPRSELNAWRATEPVNSPQARRAAEALYQAIVMSTQEDITVLARQPTSSLVMGHICTPSFWDPRHVKNASFWEIHKPVPGFPRDERVAQRLEEHIARRGPFVRFVWTLSGDDLLDHHPQHPRRPWSQAQEVWYRVERQITIPLEGAGAVFLIRTYVHPLSRLSAEQRATLRVAIELMPREIADYKGLGGVQDSPRLLSMISPEIERDERDKRDKRDKRDI